MGCISNFQWILNEVVFSRVYLLYNKSIIYLGISSLPRQLQVLPVLFRFDWSVAAHLEFVESRKQRCCRQKCFHPCPLAIDQLRLRSGAKIVIQNYFATEPREMGEGQIPFVDFFLFPCFFLSHSFAMGILFLVRERRVFGGW